jgi:hypothetical protein
MIALERNLMAVLQDAELSALNALRQIVALCRASNNLTCRELRLFEIAMEGLNMPHAQRQEELQDAIQRKRDRMMARRAAQGVDDANP